MVTESDSKPEKDEKVTTKDELDSFFDSVSNNIRLTTGTPLSLLFTDWQNHKREVVIQKDRQGKEVNRYPKFTFFNVINIMSDDQIPKTFTTTSKRLLRKLFAYFEHGATCLEITRIGQGMQTDYEVYPITQPKEEEKQE